MYLLHLIVLYDKGESMPCVTDEGISYIVESIKSLMVE